MDAARLESTTTETLQSVTNEYKIYPKFIPDIHFAGRGSPYMKDCNIEMNSAVESGPQTVLGHIGRAIARSGRAGFVVSR